MLLKLSPRIEAQATCLRIRKMPPYSRPGMLLDVSLKRYASCLNSNNDIADRNRLREEPLKSILQFVHLYHPLSSSSSTSPSISNTLVPLQLRDAERRYGTALRLGPSSQQVSRSPNRIVPFLCLQEGSGSNQASTQTCTDRHRSPPSSSFWRFIPRHLL